MPACTNINAHRLISLCLSLNPSFIFTPRLKHRCLESLQMSLMPNIMLSCNYVQVLSFTHNCFPQKIPLYFTYHKHTGSNVSFPPTHQLIQYADIYLAQRDRESHEKTGPEIFIEQQDKTRSSALCQLGLKWPEDCLMKWNKLLWLSSLAAAVE